MKLIYNIVLQSNTLVNNLSNVTMSCVIMIAFGYPYVVSLVKYFNKTDPVSRQSVLNIEEEL